MGKYIEAIIHSPWFYFLFIGGGVFIIVLGIMQYFKKEKKKSNPSTSDINVNNILYNIEYKVGIKWDMINRIAKRFIPITY